MITLVDAVPTSGLARPAEAKVYARSDVVGKGIKLVVVRWGSICRSELNHASMNEAALKP